jgi:hypothetical protein
VDGVSTGTGFGGKVSGTASIGVILTIGDLALHL